jgi:hypothetical protein
MTKKNPKKPAAKAPAKAARRTRGATAPRRRKAEPGPISPAPELAIVKRAIHEALGRDLAELLASGAVVGESSFQPARVPVSDIVERYADATQSPTRARPIDEALADLSGALEHMQRITEDESVALAAVLEPSPPNAGGNVTSPPLPESSLASMIARAALLVRQDNAVRTARLSRIDLPRG